MSATQLLYQAALTRATDDIGHERIHKVAVFNAQAEPQLILLNEQFSGPCGKLELIQPDKCESLALNNIGLSASPTFSGAVSFDLILLLPAKSKQQTLGWMATAMNMLHEHGTLLLACANRHGSKSYAAALKQLAGQTTSRSKSKCRIVSAVKTPALDTTLAAQWQHQARVRRIPSHGLLAQPGLFSWDRADPGSVLLIKQLTKHLTKQLPVLSGIGMDLCCGYGLLSEHILRHSSTIKRIHLLEADRLALDCAEKNTARWQDKVQLHWADATVEALPQQLDWIVCNPPFHNGQQRDVALGQNILRRACRSLKKNGTLYLVANRQLPYEQLLHAELKHYQILIEADGFKVIKGTRP